MDDKFAALRKTMGDKFPGEEGTGFSDYQQWVRFWEPRLYPHGDFRIASKAMTAIVREPHPSRVSPLTGCSGWTELGPFDMPLGGMQGRGVGRVTWIAFDPANANNVFTGSPKGGLFYSTNAGATWQSGGTDFLLPNIGAAHVAVDPTNGNRWFLATGEGDGLTDNGWNVSHGVYRTANKGQTWDKIGLDFSQAGALFQIKRLVIAPNNSNKIYAATSSGLYSTINALDPPANVTWTLEPTGGNNNQDAFYDIKYQPGSTSTIYASGTSLVRSLDGGVTWNPLPGIPFLGPDVVRMAMEVSPANPDYLYVVVVAKQPAVCNGTSYVANGITQPIPSSRLFRFDASKPSSQAWTDKGPVCNTGSYAVHHRGVDFSRASSIGVSPTNANHIYIADIKPVVKCMTGGDAAPCTWSVTTSTVHDDIHQVKFTPDGLTIYAASHGGVFKTVNSGATWTPQNNGLGVATVTAMSTSATDPSLILTGLFDNGSLLRTAGTTTTWRHVFNGDGMTPIIDHIDPNHMYVSAQGYQPLSGGPIGPIFHSPNMFVTPPPPNDVRLPCPNFSTYAVLNSANPATVFGACHPQVLRSTSRGGQWTAISQFAPNHEVWKIYTAPSNPDYVYAHLIAPAGMPHLLMLSTNANNPVPTSVTWPMSIIHPAALWISDIDVDEADPGKFWLTYSGFNPGHKVYYYDGTWHNLTANLANIAVNTIVHERGSDRLFIGTDIGVYSANSSSPNWSRVGATVTGQLPYVQVNDLEINYVNNKLRAGTFGRGVWEIALDPCLPTVTGPDAIIKDSAADVGNQPNNDSGSLLWMSDDIWVRNTPDHQFTYSPIPPRYSREHQHENPEYSPLPINTPYIYVKVHNRGNQPVSGKARIYWANASTGLDWELPDWSEIIPAISSTTDVVNLAPGGVWVASLQWTNIPQPQLSVGGHFCLASRFVADASTPDPIVGEVTGNGIWGNVYNSNNIAWKNLTIVDNLQNRGGGQGQLIVRNISRVLSRTQLRFDLADDSTAVLRSTRIEVDLGEKLFSLWKRGKMKGSGIKVVGPATIAIQEPHAYIDGLALSPREEHVVMYRFARDPRGFEQPEATFHVMQLDLAKEVKAALQITGGETFVIRNSKPR